MGGFSLEVTGTRSSSSRFIPSRSSSGDSLDGESWGAAGPFSTSGRKPGDSSVLLLGDSAPLLITAKTEANQLS